MCWLVHVDESSQGERLLDFISCTFGMKYYPIERSYIPLKSTPVLFSLYIIQFTVIMSIT